MEMPIRLIIVLFVALLVASSLLVFAKDIINSARNQISQLNMGREEQQGDDREFIQLASLDTGQLRGLIEECWRRSQLEATSTHCFSLRIADPASNSVDVAALEALDLDGSDTTQDVNVSTSVVASGSRAAFIEYDIVSGMVEVS